TFQVLSERTSFFGVRFYPWVLHEVFGIPATEFTNGSLDVLSFLGRSGDKLFFDILKSHCFNERITIINAFLNAKIQSLSKKFLQIRPSIALIQSSEGNIKVDD